MSNILYTAVVLDQKSRNILAEIFTKFNPDGWDWIAHHMTITMGQLDPNLRSNLVGTTQSLKIEALGKSDMAMAVKVSGCFTKNAIPHITLSVNKVGGGKPVMSNQIKDWRDLSHNAINKTIVLTGVVTEIIKK